jgi:Fe-S cluster assembly iron-binding protein IscA
MDAIAILNECKARHEAARPKRGLLGIGGGPVKLNHGSFVELAKIHDRLFADGTVTWAGMVMANTGLLKPGKRDLPAAVVYSTEGALDAAPDELIKIAVRCWSLKDTTPTDPRLTAFAAEVTDETARDGDVLVPPTLTGGRRIQYATLYVPRHRLPTGYLTDRILPVIVNPSRPAQVMLLPLEFWSPALVTRWRKLHAAHPPEVAPPPLPTDDALRAFAQDPVTLSPAALAAVKDIIRQQGLDPREVKLRVGIGEEGYNLDLTEEDVNPDTDLLYDDGGMQIVIDQTSAAQLAGVRVDFANSAVGKGFVFKKR